MKIRALAAVVALAAAAGSPSSFAAGEPFPGGIYYIQPSQSQPGGALKLLNGQPPAAITIQGQGFDIHGDTLVWADPGDPSLNFRTAAGGTSRLEVNGLYALARPSFSPDGMFVAVQATEVPFSPADGPAYLAIYKIRVSDGAVTQVSPTPPQAQPGYELPEWMANGNIAYWSASSGCTVIEIVSADGEQIQTIRDGTPDGCFNPDPSTGPRFHIASSADGGRILIPGQLQVYDAQDATLIADVRAEALAGLMDHGFQPDDRFPGQGNGGTFPLDGDLSPDGSQIVFDGAVRRDSDGAFGTLLMQIGTDGTGFTILSDLITVDPALANNHNFSQMVPMWLPSHQPDAEVAIKGKPFIGADIYGSLTEQTVTSTVVKGRTKRFIITVTNDGDVDHAFTITGSGKRSGFTINYLDQDGTSVTGTITTGSHLAATLQPGSTEQFELVIKAKKTAATGTKGSWVVTTTSDDGALDAVKVKLKIVN